MHRVSAQSIIKYSVNKSLQSIVYTQYTNLHIRHLWSNISSYHNRHPSLYHGNAHHHIHTTIAAHNQSNHNTTQSNTSSKQSQSASSSNRRRIDNNAELRASNRRAAQYGIAAIIFFVGMGYASVPIYRIFCRVTGYGGTVQETTIAEYEKSRLTPGTRDVTVSFTADLGSKLHWDFYPTQKSIQLRVGEPALAFFTAKNNMDIPIIGVATYNVTPMKAGLYFHKIQCFCM